MGSLLYTIYTLPLGDILREAGMLYHLCADDTQLYLSFEFDEPSSQIECLNKLQICVSKIKKWMTANKLKLNDEKTEVIIITSKFYQKSLQLKKFTIDNIEIELSSSVRNIGVIFDNNMTMKDQISAICKSTHYHLFNIGRIRKCITQEACEKLIHALVTSRLDNGNATLSGLPDNQLNRLQRMLNIAACIIMLTSSTNRITSILKELHWLPVKKRIEYKIVLLPFKALHGLAPQYIAQLLKLKPTPRPLRSSDANRLSIPQT